MASSIPAVASDWRDFEEYEQIRAAQDVARDISDEARRIVRDSTVVDLTLPTTCGNLEQHGTLERARAAGCDFVSLTVNEASIPPSTGTLKTIGRVLRYVAERPHEMAFARGLGDVRDARATGRLAVGVHFQETDPVEDDLGLVAVYRTLGVSHMLLAYNRRNRVADGCAESANAGLSLFGRALVKEMRTAGVLCDGSHSGVRSTLEAMEIYEGPFIFSHSNCHALVEHYRNVTDKQIEQCAATDGVIGVNGCGEFLADPYARANSIFPHVDYLCAKVGAEHVGLGLDRIADPDLSHEWVLANALMWPDTEDGQLQYVNFAPPDVIGELVDLMLAHGYDESAVRRILGENWMRVLATVWGE